MIIGSEYIGEGVIGTGAMESAVNQATETDLAQAIGKIKNKAVDQITETDLSQAVGKQKNKTVGQVTETETAQIILPCKTTGWIDGQQAQSDFESPDNVLLSDDNYCNGRNPTVFNTLGLRLFDGTTYSGFQTEGLVESEQVRLFGSSTDTWGNYVPASLENLKIQVGFYDGSSIPETLNGYVDLGGFDLGDIYPGSTVIGYEVAVEYYYDSLEGFIYIDHIQLKLYYQEPYHQEAPVVQVVETDSAQAVGRQKRKAIIQVTESDSSQAVGGTKYKSIAQVTEADTSQVIGKSKSRSISQASETDVAQNIDKRKNLSVAQTTEIDLSQTIAKQKLKAVDQTAESETVQSIAKIKSKVIVQVTEIDEALEVTSPTPQLTQVNETDIAQTVGRIKRKYLTTYSSYEIYSDPVQDAVVYYFFLEKIIPEVPEHLIENMDYLNPDVRNWKVGQSANPSFFVQLPDNGEEYVYGVVAENQFGLYSTMDISVFATDSSIIVETDVAFDVSGRKEKIISQVSETEISQIIGRNKRTAVAQVAETEVAQPVSRLKRKNIAQVFEVDVANSITDGAIEIGQIIEDDIALPILAQKRRQISQVFETDKVFPIRTFNPAKIEDKDLSVVMTNLLTVKLIVGDDIAAILSGYDIDANILQDTLEVIYETPYLQEQD